VSWYGSDRKGVARKAVRCVDEMYCTGVETWASDMGGGGPAGRGANL